MLIIPAIDLKDGACVRLRQGRMEDSTVFSDDPVAMAAKWVEGGCRRLHLVDLNGAFEGQPVNGEVVTALVPEAEVWQFTFPPRVSHAFRNIGTGPMILAAFNTEAHDPQKPDAVRDVLIE